MEQKPPTQSLWKGMALSGCLLILVTYVAGRLNEGFRAPHSNPVTPLSLWALGMAGILLAGVGCFRWAATLNAKDHLWMGLILTISSVMMAASYSATHAGSTIGMSPLILILCFGTFALGFVLQVMGRLKQWRSRPAQ